MPLQLQGVLNKQVTAEKEIGIIRTIYTDQVSQGPIKHDYLCALLTGKKHSKSQSSGNGVDISGQTKQKSI